MIILGQMLNHFGMMLQCDKITWFYVPLSFVSMVKKLSTTELSQNPPIQMGFFLYNQNQQ